ncbi:hypothetical protein N7451_012304 [Penicillium sp. IBT 35674x]|nr:hypothetical protein N7451_012304 [Penicillium sp. IBT 35674x]
MDKVKDLATGHSHLPDNESKAKKTLKKYSGGRSSSDFFTNPSNSSYSATNTGPSCDADKDRAHRDSKIPKP